MVNRQRIESPLFLGKGRLNTLAMKKLMVRGGGIQVNDTLERMGWNPDKGVVTTVMSVDDSSGVVRGVRFETRGPGPEVKFKARDLWSNADSDVSVTIKLNDLSRLTWLTEGEKRNQTEWMDSSVVIFEAIHPETGPMSSDEMAEADLEGFCLRFTLLPVKVDKMFLYGSIVPLSKESLFELLQEREVRATSPLIPTIAMKLWVAKGKFQNGYPLDFLPVEEESKSVGLGHLPLLECVGSGSPTLPNHEDVAAQLCRLLKNLNSTNNTNPQRVKSLLEPGAVWPLVTTGNISYEWPDYESHDRDRIGSVASNVTGPCFYVCIYAYQPFQ